MNRRILLICLSVASCRTHTDGPAVVIVYSPGLDSACSLFRGGEIIGHVDALNDVISMDNQLPDGYYKRAWEIVNTTDTEYLRYVAELRK